MFSPSLLFFLILPGAIGNIDCVQIVRYGGGGGGAVVAAGSRDTNIYIWRQRHLGGAGEDGKTAGGRSMRKVTTATLTGHRGWVWSLATDREYRLNLLCSGSWDREVRLWDISSGACITIIRQVRMDQFCHYDNHGLSMMLYPHTAIVNPV